MPTTNEGVLLVLGAIFFLIGVLGGGFEISAIKVPSMGTFARAAVLVVGLIFMTIGLTQLLRPSSPPAVEVIPTHTPSPPTATVLPESITVPTNTPLAATATQALTSTSGSTLEPGLLHTARIDDVWVDSDVMQFSKKGMLIHVKFSVVGLKGATSRAIAYFYDSNGDPLKDHNEQYDTVGGNVATYTEFTPIYDDSTFNDLTLFIPYSELDLPTGDYDLKFYVTIYDLTANQALANSPYIDFKFNP